MEKPMKPSTTKLEKRNRHSSTINKPHSLTIKKNQNPFIKIKIELINIKSSHGDNAVLSITATKSKPSTNNYRSWCLRWRKIERHNRGKMR